MLSDNRHIQMKLKDTGWTQQARIWVAGVQTTGSRKSAQMHAPMAPIYALEEKWRATYSDELEVWNTLSEDEQKEKRKPRLRRLCVNDATVEKLADMLSDDKRHSSE